VYGQYWRLTGTLRLTAKTRRLITQKELASGPWLRPAILVRFESPGTKVIPTNLIAFCWLYALSKSMVYLGWSCVEWRTGGFTSLPKLLLRNENLSLAYLCLLFNRHTSFCYLLWLNQAGEILCASVSMQSSECFDRAFVASMSWLLKIRRFGSSWSRPAA
jgi:hypothetical protein